MKTHIKKALSTLALVAAINTPTMGIVWFLHNNLMTQIDRVRDDLVILRKETKADFATVHEEAREARKETKAEFAKVREETKADFAEARRGREELRKGQDGIRADVSQLRAEVGTLTNRAVYIEKHLSELDEMHRGAAVYHGGHRPDNPDNEKPQ